MINKKTKTAFQFVLGSLMLASIAVACNDTETKETKTDSVVVTPPAVIDTTPKMDTASTRPIVPAN